MPVGYGIGDHRAFILDIRSTSMVGISPQPIAWPTAQCLNTKIPRCLEMYNHRLEFLIRQHRLIKKLNQAHPQPTKELIKHQVEKVDSIAHQCMI